MRTNKWLSYEDNGAVPSVERHSRLPYVERHRNPPIPQRVLCRRATALTTSPAVNTVVSGARCYCAISYYDRRICNIFIYEYIRRLCTHVRVAHYNRHTQVTLNNNNTIVIIVIITICYNNKNYRCCQLANKKLSYRRETALQGWLVMAKSRRLELRDNIYGQYRSIFNHCDVFGQQRNRNRRKTQNKGCYAV